MSIQKVIYQHSFYGFMLAMIAAVIMSCDSNEKGAVQNAFLEKKPMRYPSSPVTQKLKISMSSETFPFSIAKRVEVISYPVRYGWDHYSEDEETYLRDGLIEDGRLRLDPSNFIDRITLTDAETEELFNILYNTKCLEAMSMACFDPRHVFVFYDAKNKAFAYIEICLDCLTVESTIGVKDIPMCFEKEYALTDFLEKIGVTYFEGELDWQ